MQLVIRRNKKNLKKKNKKTMESTQSPLNLSFLFNWEMLMRLWIFKTQRILTSRCFLAIFDEGWTGDDTSATYYFLQLESQSASLGRETFDKKNLLYGVDSAKVDWLCFPPLVCWELWFLCRLFRLIWTERPIECSNPLWLIKMLGWMWIIFVLMFWSSL